QLGLGRGIERVELPAVRVGSDHQVPGRVRVAVQEHERVAAAVQDQALAVAAAVGGLAEDARLGSARALDVLDAPRRPERPTLVGVGAQRGRASGTGAGAGAGPRGRAPDLLLALGLDPLLELLAHLEERGPLGRDLHLFTRLRVPAFARLAHLHLEAAEAADLDAVALAQRLGHAIEDRVDDGLGVLLGDVRHLDRDPLDQIAL